MLCSIKPKYYIQRYLCCMLHLSLQPSPLRQTTQYFATSLVALCQRWTKLRSTPNLPANIIPTKIAWLKLSGKSPMGLGIPPLRSNITLESNPRKSTMFVGGLAVACKPSCRFMSTLKLGKPRRSLINLSGGICICSRNANRRWFAAAPRRRWHDNGNDLTTTEPKPKNNRSKVCRAPRRRWPPSKNNNKDNETKQR